MTRLTRRLPWLFALGATAACITEADDPDVTTDVARSELELLGTFTVSGQSLRVIEQDTIDATTSRITSCGQGVLYATRTDGTLWVNLDGGLGGWTQVTAGTQGTKIACDRRHLFALNSNGVLYRASTHTNGQLAPISEGSTQVWSNTHEGKTLAVPAGTDEIQGGMGNIYALVFDGATQVGTLYSSQLRNALDSHTQGTATSWVQLANNLGTNLATGAGSKATYTSFTAGDLRYRKRNRAFGKNPDDTLYYNDTLLYGQNSWTQFPDAGLDILSITADSSNTMYAVARDGFGKRLVKFMFTESNCTDGIDNDASGEADAEDANCRARLATSFCQSQPTGSSFCIDRIENTNGYSHALVTCNGAAQPTIRAGVCTKGTFGNDALAPARANPAPYDSAHYCNVHNADGTWDFEWRGTDPCATLLARHPGATIVRAGIYATEHENGVAVKCDNGGVLQAGTGTAPIETAYNQVGKTANRCVFTVSPRQLRIFQSPLITTAWREPLYGGRGYSVGHMFDHIASCEPGTPGCPCASESCTMSLSQWGNGETGSSGRIDAFGKHIGHSGYDGQDGYDYVVNEGTPLKSLGYGVVVASRDRDLGGRQWGGTTYQGEVYIRYDIGTDPEYAESFIAYYAHIGVRSVVTGQTVAPGQVIGYVGTTGSSSDPHLHFGMLRLSNTNGQRAGAAANGHAFGYRVPFTALTTEQSAIGFNRAAAPGTIDPYGWRAPSGIDPMAHRWSRLETSYDSVVGDGAWSPALFRSTEEPPYPAP